jgi:hypothetical protein
MTLNYSVVAVPTFGGSAFGSDFQPKSPVSGANASNQVQQSSSSCSITAHAALSYSNVVVSSAAFGSDYLAVKLLGAGITGSQVQKATSLSTWAFDLSGQVQKTLASATVTAHAALNYSKDAFPDYSGVAFGDVGVVRVYESVSSSQVQKSLVTCNLAAHAALVYGSSYPVTTAFGSDYSAAVIESFVNTSSQVQEEVISITETSHAALNFGNSVPVTTAFGSDYTKPPVIVNGVDISQQVQTSVGVCIYAFGVSKQAQETITSCSITNHSTLDYTRNLENKGAFGGDYDLRVCRSPTVNSRQVQEGIITCTTTAHSALDFGVIRNDGFGGAGFGDVDAPKVNLVCTTSFGSSQQVQSSLFQTFGRVPVVLTIPTGAMVISLTSISKQINLTQGEMICR